MLNEADAALAAADSRLPGLAAMLDEVQLHARLRTLPGLEALASASVRDLRYVPQVGCSATVHAQLNNGERTLLAVKALPRSALAQAWMRQKRWSPRGRGTVDSAQRIDADALLVLRPRHDPRLRALPRLCQRAARSRLLHKLLPELAASELAELRLHPRHYRPEHCFVAGMESPDGKHEHQALGVLHAAGAANFNDMLRAAQYAKALGRAKVLGTDAGLQLVATADGPGRALQIDASGLPSMSMMRALGRALAAVHDSGLLHPVLRRPHDEAGVLTSALRELQALAPALAGGVPAQAGALGSRVAQQLVLLPWEARMIHGDFSISSALAEDGEIHLRNWEQAATGDVHFDLGSLAARLELHSIAVAGTAETAAAAFEHFIDAYAAARGRAPDATALRIHTAAALLRLVGEPFRTRGPRWPQRIERLLARASVLSGATA